jgi:putative Mg2+ transporter-C (MgtC) family protein
MHEGAVNILTPLSVSELGIRLLVSLFIGIIIGLEREIQQKSAGLRTSVLICMGATIFATASVEFGAVSGIADPSRIAAQIVTGIGFLGAGTIIRTRGSVHGLTTAATIWVMASLGLAVGLGLYNLGIGGALLTLIVLSAFQWIERAMKGKRTSTNYTMLLSQTDKVLDVITQAICKSPGMVKEFKIVRKGQKHILTFNYTDTDARQSTLANELANMDGVDELESSQTR